jgi:hypothetical protein
MLAIILGGLVLFLLLGGLRAFEKAQVPTIKSLLSWIGAIGGLALALLLLLTGRGGIAIFALSLLGPLLWERLGGGRTAAAGRSGPQGSAARGGAAMSREEAYSVLGLAPGASEEQIRAAYMRLMRTAHPDNGGSDWLATRVNMARDVLLARGRR